jgi:hypothetical protein
MYGVTSQKIAVFRAAAVGTSIPTNVVVSKTKQTEWVQISC